MKKELIGILICTLLIFVAVAPVVNALTIEKNEINEVSSESNHIVNHFIKLNPPQPEEGSPDIVNFAFGLIDNLQYPCPFWTFDCVNVRCRIWDYKDECYHWYHYTNSEELVIHKDYLGILLDFFVFAIF